ncbi:hypothetical protein HYU16_04865 [Candidatus Woesearchaeota archaeon]|nr:hypothetical protein [Candidatus Woesearchaeota archaeon]
MVQKVEELEVQITQNYYPELGAKVGQLIREKEIRMGPMATELAPFLRMAPTTLSQFQSAIRSGHILGHSRLRVSLDGYVEYAMRLDRTAAVLLYVGVPPNDPCLKQIRRDHPRFRYPPLMSIPQHGILQLQSCREALAMLDKISALTPEDRKVIAMVVDEKLQQYR